MGRSQRQKGQRGERKVAKVLAPLFPDTIPKRNLNDFHGGIGTDLQNTGVLQVQVKHYKEHVPVNKIEEVILYKNTNVPMLVSWPTDAGTGKPCVVLYLDDFNNIKNNEFTELEKRGKLQIVEKHYKQYSSIDKINTMTKNKGVINILITYPDKKYGKPCIVMYLDDFINIVDKEKVNAI